MKILDYQQSKKMNEEKKTFCKVTFAKLCATKLGLFSVTIVLLMMIAVLLGVIWVATGPRSLHELTPQITKKINEQLPGYYIELEDILLAWDSWQSPLDARFKSVTLYTKNKLPVAKLDKVEVSADIFALAQGQIVLDRITMYEPTVNVYKMPDGSISLDLGYDTHYGPDLPKEKKEGEPQTIAQQLKNANIPKFLGLNELNIRDGKINLGNSNRGIITQLSDVDLKAVIDSEEINLAIDAGLGVKKNNQADLDVTVELPLHHYAYNGKASFKNIQPRIISTLHDALKPLSVMDMPVSGNVEFALDEQGNPEGGNFALNVGEGILSTDFFSGDIIISSAQLTGRVPNRGQIAIDKLSLVTTDTTISGQAKISLKEQEINAITGKFNVGALKTEKLALYWPPSQSPVSREWIIENITGGRAVQADLTLDIKPGMLDAERMPNEAVNAHIKYENMDVQFLPDMPLAKNASGVIDVNANEMKAFISTAKFKDQTKLANGNVFIGDLLADNPDITVKLSVQAPASELAETLAHPMLEISQELGLKPTEIKGLVSGEATVIFPFTLPRDKNSKPLDSAYKYDVKASLQNISQDGFLEDYHISNVSGDLQVDNKKAKFTGAGDLFGTPLQVDVLHHLNAVKNERTSIKAFGNVDDDFLQRFGIDLNPYISGELSANANIALYDNDVVAANVAADLTKATVNIEELAWQKPVGALAEVKLVAEQSAAGTNISSIQFSSGNNRFEGSLALNANGDLKQITATTLTLGDNNLQLSYAPINGGYKIYAKGNYFDATSLLDADEEKDEPFSFKDIPALDVMVDLKTLVLDEDRYIENLTGKASCNQKICTNVAITGNIGGSKPVLLSIGYEGNVRRLRIMSDDAGGLLAGLNIYENMSGGKLDINGTFNDAHPNHPLGGNAHIWDFQVYNTPVLARIITLASFGGILDALQGNGLSFEKLKTTFTLENDVITATGLRSTGDSVGITADGTIDLEKEILDFKGVVIPSYTLNSFLKNVPIVGDILTGGEAIIAANYTVQGNMEDPSVSVNPLSALAPGFLRKIFE